MKQYYKPPGAASFHSMDWMLQTFNIDIQDKSVIHIGAHTGFDAYIYHGLGAKSILWAECNPNLLPDAIKNLTKWHNEGYREDKFFNFAITNTDNEELPFYFYNNERDGTSSLLKPNGILEKIKNTKFFDEPIKVKTITLDTLIAESKFDISNNSLLNIDTQGSELLVLKGATNILNNKSLKYIICEVSFESLYEHGALAKDIDEYLSKFNFNRIFFREDCIPTHGDAIYVRQ